MGWDFKFYTIKKFRDVVNGDDIKLERINLEGDDRCVDVLSYTYTDVDGKVCRSSMIFPYFGLVDGESKMDDGYCNYGGDPFPLLYQLYKRHGVMVFDEDELYYGSLCSVDEEKVGKEVMSCLWRLRAKIDTLSYAKRFVADFSDEDMFELEKSVDEYERLLEGCPRIDTEQGKSSELSACTYDESCAVDDDNIF